MSDVKICKKGKTPAKKMGILRYKLRNLKKMFFFKVIDFSIHCVTLLSLFFLIILVFVTFKEEKLYILSIDSSKEGVERFVGAFSWCKDYLGACFIIFPVYVILSTYRIHEANHFRNNVLKPKIEKLNTNLVTIKKDGFKKNKRMFKQISSLGGKIVEDITKTEKKGEIRSREILLFYFNRYIQQYVPIFEECGYLCHKYNDADICTGEKCQKYPTIQLPYKTKRPYSLISFQQIARELFCISPTYVDFEKDIEEIYIENIDQLKISVKT